MTSQVHASRECWIHMHMVRSGQQAAREWDLHQARLQRQAAAVQPLGYRLDAIPDLPQPGSTTPMPCWQQEDHEGGID